MKVFCGFMNQTRIQNCFLDQTNFSKAICLKKKTILNIFSDLQKNKHKLKTESQNPQHKHKTLQHKHKLYNTNTNSTTQTQT